MYILRTLVLGLHSFTLFFLKHKDRRLRSGGCSAYESLSRIQCDPQVWPQSLRQNFHPLFSCWITLKQPSTRCCQKVRICLASSSFLFHFLHSLIRLSWENFLKFIACTFQQLLLGNPTQDEGAIYSSFPQFAGGGTPTEVTLQTSLSSHLLLPMGLGIWHVLLEQMLCEPSDRDAAWDLVGQSRQIHTLHVCQNEQLTLSKGRGHVIILTASESLISSRDGAILGTWCWSLLLGC